jgi:hypothetical protein
MWLSACGDSITYGGSLAAGSDGGAMSSSFASRSYYARCVVDGGSAAAAPVDPEAYERLLARHVRVAEDGSARVNYRAWAASDADLRSLDSYLEGVGSARPGACDLAFWINAYNAIVLRGVLEHFQEAPSFSVADDDFAFFTRDRHSVASESLSLDELEHGVLRGDWQHPSLRGSPVLERMMALHAELWQGEAVDARVHMALNCAALGCPNLRDSAYRRDGLDAQLADATRRFLADADRGAGPRGVSRLFEWFREDFVRDAGSVAVFIEGYRENGLEDVELGRFVEYDWALNGP